MCEDCNCEQLYNFRDEDHFFQFEKKLQSSSKLRIQDTGEKNSEPLLKTKETYYRCTSCSTVFVLSTNLDNIKKSFFLTQDNSDKYKAKLQSKDKVKSKGCVLLIVLLLSLFMFFTLY